MILNAPLNFKASITVKTLCGSSDNKLKIRLGQKIFENSFQFAINHTVDPRFSEP